MKKTALTNIISNLDADIELDIERTCAQDLGIDTIAFVLSFADKSDRSVAIESVAETLLECLDDSDDLDERDIEKALSEFHDRINEFCVSAGASVGSLTCYTASQTAFANEIGLTNYHSIISDAQSAWGIDSNDQLAVFDYVSSTLAMSIARELCELMTHAIDEDDLENAA